MPFANVSDADQEYLRQWTPPAGAATPMPRRSSLRHRPREPSSLLPPKSNLLPSKSRPPLTPLGAPGETITLEFPDLPRQTGHVAACKVRLPTQYDPAKPMPLLLWFMLARDRTIRRAVSLWWMAPPGQWPRCRIPPMPTLPQFAVMDGKMSPDSKLPHDDAQEAHGILTQRGSPKLRFVGGLQQWRSLVGTYLADGKREFIDFSGASSSSKVAAPAKTRKSPCAMILLTWRGVIPPETPRVTWPDEIGPQIRSLASDIARDERSRPWFPRGRTERGKDLGGECCGAWDIGDQADRPIILNRSSVLFSFSTKILRRESRALIQLGVVAPLHWAELQTARRHSLLHFLIWCPGSPGGACQVGRADVCKVRG